MMNYLEITKTDEFPAPTDVGAFLCYEQVYVCDGTCCWPIGDKIKDKIKNSADPAKEQGISENTLLKAIAISQNPELAELLTLNHK